jgi:hypothetical protein
MSMSLSFTLSCYFVHEQQEGCPVPLKKESGLAAAAVVAAAQEEYEQEQLPPTY